MNRRTPLSRRGFLKGGALAVAPLTGSRALRARSAGESSPAFLGAPPEAGILFSKPYGQRRIRKIQQAVRENDLDALIVCNRALQYITYASNFWPFAEEPGLALIPAQGEPSLLVQTYSAVHSRALKSFVWIDDIVDVPHEAISETSDFNLVKQCLASLKSRKLERGRIGLAGGEVDWGLRCYLREQLPHAQIESSDRVLWALIFVKDDVEIALQRYAQRYIDEVAYPAFIGHLAPGVLDDVVFGSVMGNMLKQGADASTVLLFDAGPAGAYTWASGARHRAIEKGDIVLSEPTPSVATYQVEKMYTFAVGRDIPESQKRAAQVVYESFLLLMDELKPGRELTPILEKCVAYIQGKGYPAPPLPMGHWIGVQNHEGPVFTVEGTRGWVLEPGMVMSWHPNMVVKGETRTTCSTCVVITQTGVEDLSKIKMQPMYYV
jgi:Xaa-Pro aminopeptidase